MLWEDYNQYHRDTSIEPQIHAISTITPRSVSEFIMYSFIDDRYGRHLQCAVPIPGGGDVINYGITWRCLTVRPLNATPAKGCLGGNSCSMSAV